MMEDPLKILVITYYWPPSGGAGVQRWLKMTRCLPSHGVMPVVLTVDPEKVEYPVTDPSLCADVDERVQVFRTDCFNPYGWYKRFTGKKQAPFGGFANEAAPSFRQKVARFVRGNFFLPDARRGWNGHAYREAVRLIRTYGIDTVVTTGPPMSTHLIGKKLKKHFDICWVADFRDPWTDLYYRDMLYPTWIARKADAAMERSVLLAADHITVATAEVGELLRAKSPILQAGKFSLVTNGFDASDMDVDVEKDAAFTLVYTGTMAADYPIGPLLDCLESLRDEVPVRFRLVGKIDAVWAGKISQVCGDRCEFVPYVPHKESIAEVKKASVALLVLPSAAGYQGALPGKFFEYMGAGVPVLCLGSATSEAGRVLRETGAGTGVAWDDAEGIKAFLREAYSRFVLGEAFERPEAVTQFDRGCIAASFSGIVAACRKARF